jgi:hypothetical protein
MGKPDSLFQSGCSEFDAFLGFDGGLAEQDYNADLLF